MSGINIAIEGLGELADELRRLPDQVQSEASGLVQGAARAFATVMGAQFPRRDDSGDLRSGTRLEVEGALKAVVINTTFYAAPIEGGWRHNRSGNWIGGLNVWVPTAMRTRNEMVEHLRDIVTRGRGLHLRALEVGP